MTRRGTEETFSQMTKEKIIGDVLREDADKKLSHQEEKNVPDGDYDELGRAITPLRRFVRWLRKVFKGY
jgi:hypothetical protein